MMNPEGFYYNFSGCGNTLNCNHPIVQQLIVSCLRYWVTAYRVDGFRFDLASILGRNEDGSPMEKPPLLQQLAFDPILGDVKLIAEAWDAGGLYQVGKFPSWNRWAAVSYTHLDVYKRQEECGAGWIYTAAFGSEDTRREIERQFGIPLRRVPLSVDAFSVDYRTMKWFEGIL